MREIKKGQEFGDSVPFLALRNSTLSPNSCPFFQLPGSLTTAGKLFLFRVFLSGFEGLVKPFVRLGDKLLFFVFAVRQTRFLPVEKVFVGHRVFVIRVEAESFVKIGKTL